MTQPKQDASSIPADTPETGAETRLETPEIRILAPRVPLIIFIGCLVLEIILLQLDYHISYARGSSYVGIRQFANIAREDSLASWFGTAQTMMSALTLWVIFLVIRARGCKWPRQLGWLVLALFFSYMTIDDGTQIHERLGTVFTDQMDDAGTKLPSYGWQFLFIPMFGAVGLFMLVFLFIQFSGGWWRRALLFAAGMLLVTAVGIDYIEGLEKGAPYNFHSWLVQEFPELGDFARDRFSKTQYAMTVHFAKATEESMEMLANSIMWFLFMIELSRVGSTFRVRFTRPAEKSA